MRKKVSYRGRQLFRWVILLGLFAAPGAGGDPLPLPEVDEVYPFVPDWHDARILHFGDSHLAAGYKSSMADHFRQSGAHFHQDGWVGSRSKSWISSGRLKKLVSEFRPTVVIITLGTNEMKNRRPERNRSWIRAIVDRLQGATCYWVGPPPLIEDVNGYNEMLQTAVAPCRYFDSRVLDVKPRADGTFHLTKAEGRDWGDRIWRWMNGE